MEIVSIERSTYEALQTNFNRFVIEMKTLADRGNDKRLEDWLDSQDVCQMLNISPRTLQTLRDTGRLGCSKVYHKIYYKPEDVKGLLTVVTGKEKSLGVKIKNSAHERTDHAA